MEKKFLNFFYSDSLRVPVTRHLAALYGQWAHAPRQ